MYKVQEQHVFQGELKRVDEDGKIVAVIAPVTNPISDMCHIRVLRQIQKMKQHIIIILHFNSAHNYHHNINPEPM